MLPPKVRHRIELPNRESALRDLGDFGHSVGPRIGPNKRNQNQIDDYCVRQMILGLFSSEKLPLPRLLEMLEPDPEGSWPDALLTWSDGSSSGLEVTAAGSRAYQEQLTKEERIASKLPEGEIAFFDASVDGHVGAPTDAVAKDVCAAIARKAHARLAGKKYCGVQICDLLIYENSDGGIFIESNDNASISKVVLALHFGQHVPTAETASSFRHVHLVTGRFYVHSILGNPRIYRLRSEVLEVVS